MGKAKVRLQKAPSNSLVEEGSESLLTSGSSSSFKVLRWKAKADSEVVRQFFVKPHTVSEPTRRKPVGKTLLVLNIPPFVPESGLRKMFSAFGDVGEIFIHAKPTSSIPDPRNKFFPDHRDLVDGYKVAYIVFKELRTLKEIMQVRTDEIDPLILEDTYSGMRKWIDEYNAQIVPPEVLESDIKEYMAEFEKQEVRRKEAAKQSMDADEEGWITVTSIGRKPGTKRSESTQERLKAKKRRMEAAVMNITPAQIRATKAKQLDELKKKFDEDKQKIALLKQQRKFRPF